MSRRVSITLSDRAFEALDHAATAAGLTPAQATLEVTLQHLAKRGFYRPTDEANPEAFPKARPSARARKP